MKLLESYAKICGVDVKKSEPPNIPESYYPTPEKYITLQNSSGFESKNYEMWEDVIMLMSEYLKKNNIKIVQLGDSKAPQIEGCVNLLGKTTIAQSNYIIRRAMLHMGNDSCQNYLCASSNTPLISVYGPTSLPNHSPYHLPAKRFLADSHRWGKKPSLSYQEHPKTINLISPEIIAEKALEFIGAGEQKINERTCYLGLLYKLPALEIIPNFFLSDARVLNGRHTVIRSDICIDYNNIRRILSSGKVALVADKNFDFSEVIAFKQNILGVSYNIDLETDPKTIEKAKQTGLNIIFFTKDTENLEKIRLKYFDECSIEVIGKFSKNDLEEKIRKYTNNKEYSIDFEKLYFYTRRIVLSNNSIFPSIFHAKHNLKDTAVHNNEEFLEEIENIRIVIR